MVASASGVSAAASAVVVAAAHHNRNKKYAVRVMLLLGMRHVVVLGEEKRLSLCLAVAVLQMLLVQSQLSGGVFLSKFPSAWLFLYVLLVLIVPLFVHVLFVLARHWRTSLPACKQAAMF